MADPVTLARRVDFRVEDMLASEDGMKQLLSASLIHIDINHHGDIEDAILQVTKPKKRKTRAKIAVSARRNPWHPFSAPCGRHVTCFAHTTAVACLALGSVSS